MTDNILSTNWNAFWNFIIQPDEKTWWNMWAVSSAYYVVPFVGGYARAMAYAQHTRDIKTYDRAEVSEDYIFAQLMEMFKLSYWGFFNLIDENLEIEQF